MLVTVFSKHWVRVFIPVTAMLFLSFFILEAFIFLYLHTVFAFTSFPTNLVWPTLEWVHLLICPHLFVLAAFYHVFSPMQPSLEH